MNLSLCVKLRDKKSVHWRRFPAGFSKVQSSCPEEYFSGSHFNRKFVFKTFFLQQFLQQFLPVQQSFPTDCSNFLSTCPMEHFREKTPNFYFLWFWGSRRKTFRHLVEWFRQSCRDSNLCVNREVLRKVVLFQKISVFLYLFPKFSKTIILLIAFVLRQCFQNCFLRRRRKRIFFPGRSVFHQYFHTWSENFDAVW